MTTGPIDFGDEEVHATGYSTELGGVDGLIQPEVVGTGSVESGTGHEDLTESEKATIVARRAKVPLTSHEAWTGEPDTEDIVDPVTGRLVDPADLEDVTGTGGTPSDLAPKPPLV